MKKLVWLLVAAIGTWSCSKEDNEGSASSNRTVYVAVNEYDDAKSIYVPKIFKNKEEIKYSNGVNSARINNILISGNDFYAVGYIEDANKIKRATYWKNGVANTIKDDFEGIGKGIQVVGDKVYMSLTISNFPYVWDSTNGLKAIENATCFIGGLVVDNSDVYVGGAYNNQPVIWKNGVKTYLANNGWNYSSNIFDIAKQGTDLYAVGTYGNKASGKNASKKVIYANAAYWKNGTAVKMEDEGRGSVGEALWVNSKNEVYVAGYLEATSGLNKGKIWKNGVAISLSECDNVQRITGVNENWYAAGTHRISNKETGTRYYVKVWKNGQESTVYQVSNYLEVTGIAVK